jgi:outer membrane protein TolC
MKRPFRFFIVATAFSLISVASTVASVASASDTLSLKKLLDEARANNFEIRVARERVRAKEARAGYEGALEDPVLKIEVEEIDVDRPFDLSSDNAMLTRYTLSQEIPFPGKRALKKKTAVSEANGERARFKARELDVALMVKEAYYDYSLSAESIDITREIKELVLSAGRVAEVRYSLGQASQQDAIKAGLEAFELANELITLEAEKNVSAARLKSALGREQGTELGEPARLPRRDVAFNADDLAARAVKESFEIKEVEAEVETSELNAKLARKESLPDFMVGAGPVGRDGRVESFDLMFQMNIPLWQGKYSGIRAEAAASESSARLMLLSQRNEKSLEVKDAALMAEAARQAKALLETGLIPQAELAFESALKNYQSGSVDFLALIDAARELKRTKLEYIKTLSEYGKRIAALERAVGEEIAEGL